MLLGKFFAFAFSVIAMTCCANASDSGSDIMIPRSDPVSSASSSDSEGHTIFVGNVMSDQGIAELPKKQIYEAMVERCKFYTSIDLDIIVSPKGTEKFTLDYICFRKEVVQLAEYLSKEERCLVARCLEDFSDSCSSFIETADFELEEYSEEEIQAYKSFYGNAKNCFLALLEEIQNSTPRQKASYNVQ